MHATQSETRSSGQLCAAISNAVVRRLAETTGRGPTKSRTTIDEDSVFVLVQNVLTKGEQALVGAGDEHIVHQVREAWHRAVRAPLDREIEKLTGRRVVGSTMAHHLDADFAVVTFLLAPAA